MLGSRANPSLSAKAAETEGLLSFVTGTLKDHLDRFGTCGKTQLIKDSNALEAKLLLAACESVLS
jgi:hypothetical protein